VLEIAAHHAQRYYAGWKDNLLVNQGTGSGAALLQALSTSCSDRRLPDSGIDAGHTIAAGSFVQQRRNRHWTVVTVLHCRMWSRAIAIRMCTCRCPDDLPQLAGATRQLGAGGRPGARTTSSSSVTSTTDTVDEVRDILSVPATW
jgi:hypothetical protein